MGTDQNDIHMKRVAQNNTFLKSFLKVPMLLNTSEVRKMFVNYQITP